MRSQYLLKSVICSQNAICRIISDFQKISKLQNHKFLKNPIFPTRFHGKYQIDERYRYHVIGSQFSEVENHYETRDKQLKAHLEFLRRLDTILQQIAFDMGKCNEYLQSSETAIECIERDDFNFIPEEVVPPNLAEADLHIQKLKENCHKLISAEYTETREISSHITVLSSKYQDLMDRYTRLVKEGRTVKKPGLADTDDFRVLQVELEWVRSESRIVKSVKLVEGMEQTQIEQLLLFHAGKDKIIGEFERKKLQRLQSARHQFRQGSKDEQTYVFELNILEKEYAHLVEISRNLVARLEQLQGGFEKSLRNMTENDLK